MENRLTEGAGITALLIATLFWGSTFAFTKELTVVLTPLWIVAIRFVLSTIVLLFIFTKRIINSFRTTLKENSSHLLLLGFFNFSAIVLQTYGLVEIPASNAGFITSLSVLFVPFIEYFWRKRRVYNNIKVAVILALIGMYVISYGFSKPSSLIRGDLLVFLCAIIYSFYIISVDILSKKLNPAVLMFYVFGITAILSLPLAIVVDGFDCVVFGSLYNPSLRNAYLHMSYLIVFGSIIPYILIGIGQRIIDPQRSALIYMLEPVFAMTIAILLFGEDFVWFRIIGGGIILIAQVIGIRRQVE